MDESISKKIRDLTRTQVTSGGLVIFHSSGGRHVFPSICTCCKDAYDIVDIVIPCIAEYS